MRLSGALVCPFLFALLVISEAGIAAHTVDHTLHKTGRALHNKTGHRDHSGPDPDMQAADEALRIADQVTQETDPEGQQAALLVPKKPAISAVARKADHMKRTSTKKAGHAHRKKHRHYTAQPVDQAATDAANAHKAAETAKQAAAVANKVARHSVHMTVHAKDALKTAKDAVHKARVDTQGLSIDQKESLQKAEAKLTDATKSTEYGAVKDARYAEMEGSLVNKDLDGLQKKLDQSKDLQKTEMTELEQMRSELKQIAIDLEKKTGRKLSAAEAEDLLQEEKALQSLEEKIAQVEGEVASGKSSTSSDEIKVEIGKLREAVDGLEMKTLEYTLPTKKKQLIHEIPVVPEEEAPATGSPTVETVGAAEAVTPSGSMDIDTDMPYGDLEPFGREDTAQELTESSIRESDEMVDQLERAEVAEEKRAVFRALTRLRGAAITSFDGVARSQTGNIDEYNKVHKWRNSHPLHHLADEESDIAKWAFPDNADFL